MTFVIKTMSDGEASWKSFAALGAARIGCQRQIDNGADKTEIWHTPIDEPRQAIAAIKAGDGLLVEAYTPRASPMQIAAAEKMAVMPPSRIAEPRMKPKGMHEVEHRWLGDNRP